MKKSTVKFNAEALKKKMFVNLVEVQTERLIEYAEDKIRLIGDAIMLYSSRNHMDRTGNLLNSLCWGVKYKGELKSSGFYRTSAKRDIAWLHEFTPDTAEEVDGRECAEAYLNKQKSKGGSSKGWYIFFAILAPYWGYWERGFRMKSGGGDSPIPRSTRFLRMRVMGEVYDMVRMDLKPAKPDITVFVAPYVYHSNKYRGKNRRVGSKRLMSSKEYLSSLQKGNKRRKRIK